MITTLSKIERLKEEFFQDLSRWEKDFIDEIYENISGLGDEFSDEKIKDFLTERQILKVDEIWRAVNGWK